MCQQKISDDRKLADQLLYKRLSQKQQQLAELFLDQLTETSSPSTSRKRNGATASRLKELIRIVGGVPALKGEFDECCLIGIRNGNGTIEWFCTGVLIHPGIVVTAAHCIEPGGGYVVALRTNNQNSLRSAEIINVRKTNVHPGYLSTQKFNDIAVLVLQNNAQTPPVRCATSGEINSAAEVELVGFGNDDVQSTKGFGIKRKVEVEIISIRTDVNQDLNAEEALHDYESDLEFVAGGKGFDTCNGDSGGPVYITIDGNRVVAGLTSRGSASGFNPCGDGGVYTRIDVHQGFIQSFISNS